MIADCMHRQQNADMPTITIRDIPEPVRAELASRAALAGKSLQELLRNELIELARRPTAQTLISRIHARKEATGSSLPRKRILTYRDEGRR